MGTYDKDQQKWTHHQGDAGPELRCPHCGWEFTADPILRYHLHAEGAHDVTCLENRSGNAGCGRVFTVSVEARYTFEVAMPPRGLKALTWTTSTWGGVLIEFEDSNENAGRITASSAVGEPSIWFGSGMGLHLTQTMVDELLPILHHFALHGALPESADACAEPDTDSPLRETHPLDDRSIT